ncbi:galactonate dehydratase [Lacticaseibacillus rhamnosus MTCC 5462]|nr:galactonate dehydratase [Lacticaseibacillus rhamnosus MTCC 5462]
MGKKLIGRDPFEIERLWQEMHRSFSVAVRLMARLFLA